MTTKSKSGGTSNSVGHAKNPNTAPPEQWRVIDKNAANASSLKVADKLNQQANNLQAQANELYRQSKEEDKAWQKASEDFWIHRGPALVDDIINKKVEKGVNNAKQLIESGIKANQLQISSVEKDWQAHSLEKQAAQLRKEGTAIIEKLTQEEKQKAQELLLLREEQSRLQKAKTLLEKDQGQQLIPIGKNGPADFDRRGYEGGAVEDTMAPAAAPEGRAKPAGQ